MSAADRIEVVRTAVLIIGAGAAGLRTAIELAQYGVACLVIGKRRHGDAHTRMAAGGINAVFGSLDPEDRWPIHAADTIREGHDVCDPVAVELLCRNAPARVRELQAWGCPFDLTDDGAINQRYFGAQSFRRTCFVGDRTGEAILQTLLEKAHELKVPTRNNLYVTRLLTDGRRVTAAVALDLADRHPVLLQARAFVLAAAGLTRLYDRSTSRAGENTGDAAALACDAGATVRDMEFVQFHPTGMIKPPQLRGQLVTEAARGEGAHLLNAQGERFMQRYSPQHMELDARDVVARAIYEEILTGRGTEDHAVLLDISHKPADHTRQRLPKLHRQFLDLGIDITKQPMEVAPSAHYAMGGVRVDFATGATTVGGLYCVGEASGGMHGGNRLGGNSLADTVVFGQITGESIAREIDAAMPEPDRQGVEAHLADLARLRWSRGRHQPHELTEAIGRLMWRHAGIVRTRTKLEEGLRHLAELKAQADDLSVAGDGEAFQAALNLRFMLVSAELLFRSALHRDESRGAHFLREKPENDPAWQKNIFSARGDDGQLRLWTEAVPPVPQQIQRALEEGRTLDYHHLE